MNQKRYQLHLHLRRSQVLKMILRTSIKLRIPIVDPLITSLFIFVGSDGTGQVTTHTKKNVIDFP